MTPLILPASRNTPNVHFEPSTSRYEMTGISVPENASEYYEPIFNWLAANLPQFAPGNIFHFHLTYFNSTSLKAIFHVLKLIKDANIMGAGIVVRWYVEPDDEFMTESASLFTQMLDLALEVIELPADRPASMAS